MMTAKRPYLVRAIHQWIVDNGKVPYMMVDATQPAVVVPKEHIVDGNIVLNVDPKAVSNLFMGQWFIRFSARFARGYFECSVPLNAILGIYTSDTNEGYFFDPDDLGETVFPKTLEALEKLEGNEPPDDGGSNGGSGSKGKGASHLTLVK